MTTTRPLQRWFYRRSIAGVIATACFGLALAAAWSLQQLSQRADAARLDGYSRDLRTLISQRMLGHEQILRGGAGLFDASATVTRQEWRRYIEQLKLTERYPGIQGVGFSERVPAAELDRHVARIRAEGFPDYQVKPAGARTEYSAIIYLEPFAGRNLAAFGYDMLSEPVRGQAMRRAMRTGEASLSGAVTLLQETHGAVQPGFLLYMPVYGHGADLTNPDARERATIGWIYSPFRAYDLLQSMLHDWGQADVGDFALIDGLDSKDPTAVLFRSDADAPVDWHTLRYSNSQTLHLFGRDWTLVSWLPESQTAQDQTALAALLLGSMISALIMLLLRTLANREARANQIADLMTSNYRQSEAALAASAQRANAIIDNVADAILTVASDGTVLQANPAAARLFGYEDESMIGSTLQQLLPAVPQEQLQALLRDASQSAGQTTTTPLRELEGRRKNQTSVPIEMALSVLPQAEPETFIAVCRDVTARRRVDRLKREFVATVSHELRTPLTSIAGSLDLLVSNQFATLPGPVRDLLLIAHRNSKRLAELINDLLDIEQISRGQLTLFLEDINVQGMLEHVMSAIEPYAHSLGVTLQQAECEPTWQVRADRKRLHQVLTNLLSNAIKYSPRGGLVVVHTTIDADHLRISVEDQGPGVPKEFEARLFQQFSRADSSDHRRVGGTGLGLAISKELIERMHGQIGYRALQPRGACFYIELPLLAASAQ
ncbi:MAG: CHASE domain-containing protein [Permianibacter sp.]